jgi:hypothetical protein
MICRLPLLQHAVAAILCCTAVVPMHADDGPALAPNTTAIPLVEDADAAALALASARQTGVGLVADLADGHAGVLVKAAAASPLAPSVYRLHALVGSTAHDHILGEAVALRLSVGDQSAQFERAADFPQTAAMSHVWLDFIVEAGATPEIRAEWLVGDSKLDRAQYRNVGKARAVYRAQRQNAINQYELKQAPTADTVVAENVDELDVDPVEVLAVRTDEPAYAAGSSATVTVELQNRSTAAVSADLRVTIAEDIEPGTVLTTLTEQVALAAGARRTHTQAAPASLQGVGVVGHVTATVSAGGLRANQAGTPFVILPPVRASQTAPDKRIFAHYMGCWPIGYGPLPWERRNEGKHLKHESKDPKLRRGGHVRNYALAPQALKLSPEESADLEIRRALRIGIDGFAIDAWAGDKDAKRSFDALIRVAAEKDYPFEITVCIDPSCGGRLDETVKWILEKYGDNPKLARRDNRPLIFGYGSTGPSWGFAEKQLGVQTEAERFAMRRSPLAWHLAGAAFSAARREVGTPVFYHFDYGHMRHPYHSRLTDADVVPIIGTIARYVDAVGAFSSAGHAADETAAAVKAAGAEWSDAPGMYQKENIPYEVYAPLGSEWMEGKWRGLRARGTTLTQLITWNDYGENSNIAPGYETRYTLYDLTGYHIAWWKTGKQPEVAHDRVYLIYAKYPRGAKVWPFAQGVSKPRKLEVLTILPTPATIRLPGRDIAFAAPAGYSKKQFPLTVGPVVAEVVRDGKVVSRITSPEPITDRPFRESNGIIAYSTEFMRHWQADFGDAEPFLYGEYADDDGDGLPNWFEMYWFTEERGFRSEADEGDIGLDAEEPAVTRWLDIKTMTAIAPDADPDGDGKTNLEEYHERTDPTVPAAAQ